MSENKCKHCTQGFSPYFFHGKWEHAGPDGFYVCTDSQKKDDDRLKLFQAHVIFPAGRMPAIEMILLDTNGQEAGHTVVNLLEADGYDPSEMALNVKEIEGPFNSGFIISRNGG